MEHPQAITNRVQELVRRSWNVSAIEERYRKLHERGIPEKKLDLRDIVDRKEQILDNLQYRAEEYEYVSRN